MRKHSVILFLLFLFILSSCKGKLYSVYQIDSVIDQASLPSMVSLNGGFAEIESANWIRIKDSYAFVINDTYSDSLLCEIRGKEGKILCRFIRKGNGPGEYLSPYLVELKSHDNGLHFTLLDKQRGRVIKYYYDPKENQVVEENEVQLGNDVFPLRHLLRTDKGYIGIRDNMQKDIITLDESFDTPTLHPYLDLDVEMTPKESQLFQTMACVSPDGKRVALAYFHLPRVDILSSDGTTRHVCYYGKRLLVEESQGSGEYYFGAIECDNDYLYVKYEGAGENIILKLAWDGRPVLAYDVPVMTFCCEKEYCYVLNLNRTTGMRTFSKFAISD